MNQIMLLSLHHLVGGITLIGTLAVVFTIVFVISTSKNDDADHTAKEKVYSFRRKYFWSLTAILSIGFLSSLAYLPYEKKEMAVDKTFSVLSFQWGWKISAEPFGNDVSKLEGKNKIEVDQNDNVKFIVTTRDVNHSFGIYNAKGEMVTQVQAMPGYKNELVYHFEEKGIYRVLCMEYCGVAHAMMLATIEVN